MEESVIAQSVCILSSVDIGCTKTALTQGCLISAWHSLLLLTEGNISESSEVFRTLFWCGIIGT